MQEQLPPPLAASDEAVPAPVPSPPPPDTRSTLRERLGLWGVILAAVLFYLTTLNYPMQRCDDIYYVIGAKSIAQGVGYADISRSDAPYLTKYAPLASLTLAPFVNFVGNQWRMLRLVSMASLLLVIPLVYTMLRCRIGHRGALLLLLLFLFNPIIIHSVTLQGNGGLMVAIPLVVAFLLDQRLSRRVARRDLILLCAALVAAFYTHRSSVALIIAAVIFLGLRLRRPRAAFAVFAVVVALAFPWMWRSHAYTGHWISRDYETEISGMLVESEQRAQIRNASAPTAALTRAFQNLPTLPPEIGHGLWPWSKGSGGHFWPALARLGLGWTQTLTLWGAFLLVVVGWVAEWRNRRSFPEWHLPLHTAMMLLFFIGIQYYGFALPFLYFYLWRGVEVIAGLLRSRRASSLPPVRLRALALIGFWVLLLPCLAKDMKVYWGNSRLKLQDRELRWQWVTGYVPADETVYWYGLENYSWAPWRWYDSGRKAIGISDKELEAALVSPVSSVHYVCLPAKNALSTRLEKAGWKQLFQESPLPTPPPELLERMSMAQQAYIRALPPAQILWHRPGS